MSDSIAFTDQWEQTENDLLSGRTAYAKLLKAIQDILGQSVTSSTIGQLEMWAARQNGDTLNGWWDSFDATSSQDQIDFVE